MQKYSDMKITDIVFKNGRFYCHVLRNGVEKTVERIESFRGGLQHRKVAEFKTLHPATWRALKEKREQYLEKQGRVSSPSPRRKPFIGLLDSDDDTENSESESVESGNSSKRNESSQKKIKEPQSSTYFPDLSSDEESDTNSHGDENADDMDDSEDKEADPVIEYEVTMIENMRLEGGELMFETLWSDMSKTWKPLCSFGEDGLKHESLQIFKRKNLKKWETLLKKAHIREPCSQTQEIKPTSSNSEPDIEYRVKMIKKMKFEEGELLFQTMWSDTSTTWEPLSSFGDEGLDHSSLQQFRSRFPEIWEKTLEEAYPRERSESFSGNSSQRSRRTSLRSTDSNKSSISSSNFQNLMDTDDDIDEDNRSSIMMFPNESELGDEREEEEEQIEEEEDDDICLGPSQEGRRTDGRASREDVVVDLEEAEIGELEEPVTQNHAHRLVQNNELAGRRMINFDRNEVYMEAICQIKKWRPTIVRLPSNGSTIHDAIMQLIDDTVKKMLLRIDREIILEELSRNFSLHKVMMAVYTKLDTGKVEKTKIVMNLVLSKIPLEILSVRNHGRLSTLLHVAITTRLGALARRMVRLGSPLHLINQEFLTPVDFCIVNGQLENFELCLQYGGTFHYILQGFLEGTYNDSLRYLLWTNPTEIANEFLRIARSANNKMREECVRIRQELGPLMAELDESVINRFCGSPNVPRMRTRPALCRTECELVNIQNRRTIFFDCTEALKRHFGNVERSRMSPPIWRSQPSGPTLEGLTSTYYENTVHVPFHKRVCTVTLDFAVGEVYSFVTCQIIRYRKNLNVQQPQQLPCTSNYQPSTSSQQPSTSNHQPRYSYNQQSTSNYQPSASNQQPSTSSQQPSTSNHQPRYSYNQPTTSTMRSGFSTNHNL